MLHLIAASLIWAFSFGIIKTYLGGLNPVFTAAARLGLSCLIFLPFFRPGILRGKPRLLASLAFAGALEYGVMYIAYLSSFRVLPAWQVALFTVFTPLYVWLIHEVYDRRIAWARAIPATLAVAGSAWMSFREFDGPGSLTGFLLVQASNLCFAWGQIHYRFTIKKHALDAPTERALFATLYLAGFLLTAALAVFQVDFQATFLHLKERPDAMGALLYSGWIASGLAFYLWNRGATQAPPSVLAALNNLKAPLAMAVAILVFGEVADIKRLTAGLAMLGIGAGLGVWLERRRQA
jgi:drug/metabolite transporter (DMT)-like permease